MKRIIKAALMVWPFFYSAKFNPSSTSIGNDFFSSQISSVNNRSVSETCIKSKGNSLEKRIYFTENKGQVRDQNGIKRDDILFGLNYNGMATHIRNSGVSYQLFRIIKDSLINHKKYKYQKRKVIESEIYRVDLNWLNFNRINQITYDEVSQGYANYYMPSKLDGINNVKSYTGFTLKNIWDKIDIHYYSIDGKMKHDYIIEPGGDYHQIKIEVDGAKVEIKKDGSLILSTPFGSIREDAPIVFQQNQVLKSKWIFNNGVLSFEIENYNPNYRLIIDPITRVWDTFYGGDGDEAFFGSAIDNSGNIYQVGYTTTNTASLIATSGSHQNFYGGGWVDACLVKFNSNGIRQFASYYGGNADDYFWSCSSDNMGNLIAAGHTEGDVFVSNNDIATPGSHQISYGGGFSDGMLVKFNSSGVRLWATYYGGEDEDVINSCDVDNLTNDIYISGYTNSDDNLTISTLNSYQINKSDTIDAFLVKFNGNGIRQWGSYYGGNGEDFGWSCKTNVNGEIYLCGATSSSLNISSNNSHQSTFTGGNADAYFAKFSSTGQRLWATYYGGDGDEELASIATNGQNEVFLVGATTSTNNISTNGAHQSTHNWLRDGFAIKFNASGTQLWGTYYGGMGEDFLNDCTVDSFGNLFICGFSDSTSSLFPSTNLIATTGAFQSNYGGGMYDAFLAKLNNSGVRNWGSYYGGNGVEGGLNINVDSSGGIYLSGGSDSTNLAMIGGYQLIHGGSIDGFLVKFIQCTNLNPIATTNSVVCMEQQITLNSSYSGTNSPTFNWYGPNSFTSSVQNPTIANANPTHVGIYTLVINNGGCVETATTQITNVSECTGITAVNLNDVPFKIYPNPTLSDFIISFDTKTIENISVQIIDSKGILLNNFTGDKFYNCRNEIKIDLTAYCSGVYFVNILIDNKLFKSKIVKL
ncbi:MAG: T9SS type A sorting domain-containing protein [Sphingobacteriaceae bacterium]|jgi:hypothetical protein